jgi:hypothetical protein
MKYRVKPLDTEVFAMAAKGTLKTNAQSDTEVNPPAFANQDPAEGRRSVPEDEGNSRDLKTGDLSKGKAPQGIALSSEDPAEGRNDL